MPEHNRIQKIIDPQA